MRREKRRVAHSHKNCVFETGERGFRVAQRHNLSHYIIREGAIRLKEKENAERDYEICSLYDAVVCTKE